MKEAKLTIEEISKNFQFQLLDSATIATFLIKCDSLAGSCDL